MLIVPVSLLLLAYFTNIPGVLDYLPIARCLMSILIIAFCSVQISLASIMRRSSKQCGPTAYLSGKTPLAWMVFSYLRIHFFVS